ncbi:hypothetical protein N9O17_03285 [Candidatus Pelagibacter sp.]|nr:hypothetical protein [Candidatus Pelagibacter sp.]
MKFNYILILLTFIFFTSCEQYNINNSNKLKFKPEKKYKNSGFTIIYNEKLDIKSLDSRSLQIFHKNLKAKSFVKITNPINDKSVIAEVKSNKVEFSNFYNSVITNRIAKTLDLNLNEPYVEIVLISKNSTFIAKKANTFEEEKEVAETAPVDGVKISSLNDEAKVATSKSSNDKFSYSIKVADFYYKKTAMLMIDRIKLETLLNNIKVIQLSKTNYRVLLGPFNDIKSLKDSFEKMNSLYFENLEILKNV